MSKYTYELAPELRNRLLETLPRCGPFDDEAALRAIFVDARIAPWREALPHAHSPADRVNRVIDYLHDQYTALQENALVLLLHVLADGTLPANRCHQELTQLAADLAAALPTPDSPPIKTLIRAAHFPFQEPYYRLAQREAEVAQILDVLRDARGRAAVLVSGLGGMGKTALAVEVARRCDADASPFPAILWESAKQEIFVEGTIYRVRDATLSLAALVDSLGCQLVGPDFAHQPDVSKETALQKALTAIPSLVLVDNLETAANAREVLLRLQRLLGRSRALITSREVVPGDAFRLRLEGLPEGSALEFLRAEGRQRGLSAVAEAEAATLSEICRITQGMPLAMKMVVAQTEGEDLETVLRQLAAGQGHLYFFIFLAAWQRLSDLAKQVLIYLGPTVAPVSREELTLAFAEEPAALPQALQELQCLSLVQPGGALTRPAYSLHQLTRYFVVNDLPEYWRQQGWL